MGMTIDDSERYLRIMLGGMKYAVEYWKDKDKEESDIEQTNVEAVETALDIMRKYQQLQADYENRLKADKIAMLEDLDLQIDESAAYNLEVAKVQRLIRDKINALRGGENEENE